MKNKLILICLLIVLTPRSQIRAQNLPSPASNYKLLPTGSLVIAMDNTYQSNNINMFNLKAYGLVVYLLNNNVKLKWVIKTGKLKDDVDFNTSAGMIKPIIANVASYDFKSGPFVIYSDDTTNVSSLIDAYNSSITNINDKVKVYQTNVPVYVDQRYDLTGFKPKAALLNNGGNWEIHRDYLIKAGINFGLNSTQTAGTNWAKAVVSDMMSSCYTFGSEAHWSERDPLVALAVTNDVRTFLQAGGNILAECAAVRTYENAGKFHSTGGIDPLTENDFNSPLSTLNYSNADLSYSQFQGPLNISKGGSLKNWTYSGSLQNDEHNHVEGTLLNNNAGASVAKISGTPDGGLLFYLGNHNFDRVDDLSVLNGIRMYLNAFLTPSNNNGMICLTNPVLNSNYQNGEMCFVSRTKSNVSANVAWSYDIGNETYTIRTTLSKDYVDNTYGNTNMGWGLKSHKFTDMVNSEFLQIGLKDFNGVKRMEFKIDYLTASSNVASGYKSLGVSGGDGAMLIGNASDIVNVRTSLDANFNEYGYILTSNSPSTNNYYIPNPLYPNWIYEVWYEVTVKASAFGSSGFGSPTIAALNASPSKAGSSKEAVSIGQCPQRYPMGDKGIKNPASGIVELNIYPNPVKTNLNLNIIAEKQIKGVLKVTDFSGKIVMTKMLNTTSGVNNQSYDISNLKIGMYTLQFITGNSVINQKFFVIK